MLHRDGFTLIELLVVVSLIALLIGLLLPALGAARDRGRAIRCLANVRTLGQAMYLYVEDYEGYFPLSSYTTLNAFSPNNWIDTLEDYGVTPDTKRCPDDPTERFTSFLVNDFLAPNGGGFDRLERIARPSAVGYAAEAHPNYTSDHFHAYLDAWTLPDDMTSQIDVERHRGSSYFVYLDGHAAGLPWATLRTTFGPQRNLFDPDNAR